MKIQLLVVGKTNQDFVQKGVEEFCMRLKHYFPFELKVIPDIRNVKSISVELQKEKEGDLILKSIHSEDFIILLDEHGKEFSSSLFADYIEKKKQTSVKQLIFVIGGAYGFSAKVLQSTNEKIALSRMTFSHQLARLVFVEQLYRAATILNKEPYHHE